jgi:hypothetical protein
MAALAFGRFRLIDPGGESVGDVIIAAEHVLLQRGPSARIRDVSYLALWSASRIDAIGRELQALASVGSTTVGPQTPEVHGILHAIAPTATPLFVGGGRCRRRFARVTMKAELERSTARQLPRASAR